MTTVTKASLCVAASVLAFSLGVPVPACADDASTLKSLQEQINELQKQIAKLQAAQTKSAKAAEKAAKVNKPAVAAVPAATPVTPTLTSKGPAEVPAPVAAPAIAQNDSLKGYVRAKTGVDITLGGFIDATSIYRSKSQGADVGSNFNTSIPFNNVANAHQSEFRESARATRLSLLATGSPDPSTKLTGYFEADFQAAASTSTQTQTNSYVPRMRHGFAGYEDSDLGLHFWAGQTWSLITPSTLGLDPLKHFMPMVVDNGFVPGANFTRAPQLRLAKDFMDKKLWVGISAESPAAVTGGLCTSGGVTTGETACYSPSNAASRFNTTYQLTNSAWTGNLQGNLTTDIAPDVVVKVAYDPGFGHYELMGVTRFFHDTTGTTFHNNTAMGGGIGAQASLPVVSKKLDFHASVLVGKGIGRYGAAQLPDYSVSPNGKLKPIGEYTALVGLVGHPSSSVDTYLYAGLEQAFRQNEAGIINNAYGYGNFGVNNANCYTPGSTACFAQTSSVWQITPGVWYRIYNGSYGKMQLGLQHSWTRRNAFSDSNGVNPHAIENITMFSVRYSPF